MPSVFAQYGFVQVIFVAALIAILLQCLVYPIRRWLGLRAASIVLRGSLAAFLLVAVASLVTAWFSGSLEEAANHGGSGAATDFAFFIALTMFVSYFMGARYLADERERSGKGAQASAPDADRGALASFQDVRGDDADPRGA